MKCVAMYVDQPFRAAMYVDQPFRAAMYVDQPSGLSYRVRTRQEW
jgi:hypothetical protein